MVEIDSSANTAANTMAMENTTVNTTVNTTENTTENATENTTENAAENTTENTTENATEITTTTTEETCTNNEHTAITITTSGVIGEPGAEVEEITTLTNGVSMDDEKQLRIIQIIGEGHSKKQSNNMAETSKINDNNKIIHEFDAMTEDPFTLESFDTLIQQHSEKDKDFIIARVTTVDPSDESKSYHSYYSAHHINKVLFRTQPDQGLLHRMKAKNPLNNMNIIGDVHYYVIKASSVKKLPTFAKPSSMSIESKKTLKVKGEDATIVATSSLDRTEKKGISKFDSDNDDESSNKLHSAPPSIWNFNDDEKPAIEMLPCSNNNKRWSCGDSIKPVPKAHTVGHSFRNNSSVPGNENLERLLTSSKLQTDDDSQSSKVVPQVSQPKNNEVSISIPDNNDDPSLNKFDSSNIIAQSPTKDLHEDDDSIYYKAIFYATDDDFLMHSTIRQFFKTNALDSSDAQLFTINTLPNNNNSSLIPPSTQLERMVTNHETFLLDPMVIGNVRPVITRNVESIDENTSTSRWQRIVNNMRTNKGLRWLVLMYMVFGFLLIRFVVSETYAYLMAFLLMLCLFLVFCVGSGVGVWGR